MCRLAIFSGIRNQRPLMRALTQLEDSMGGHGNGYWDTQFQEVIKGLALTPNDIADMAYDQKGIHLFHTRLATAGGMKDELNHPFEGENWTVMHNGHWFEWDRYAEYEMSDTQCAARLIDERGPGVLLNEEFDDSGVWIMARRGEGESEIYVCSRSSYRNFMFQRLKNGGFFHASERIKNFAVSASMLAEESEFYRILADGSVLVVDMPSVSMPEPLWDSAWWEYYKSQHLGNWGSATTKYDDTFDDRRWWEKESWGDEDYEDGLLGIRKTPYNAGADDDQLVLELPEQPAAGSWERFDPNRTTSTNVVPMSRALPAPTEDDFDEEVVDSNGMTWRRYGKLWRPVRDEEYVFDSGASTLKREE